MVEVGASEFHFPKKNILTFAMSDVAGTYVFNYTENDVLVRNVVESESEILEESGEKLTAEKHLDASENIWSLIEHVLGK